MKIFGREIKPEVATMCVNIMGFVASMIFYCTVETGLVKQIPSESPLQVELVKTDASLKEEVKQLRTQQDSLLKVLNAHVVKLEQTSTEVQKEKIRIINTVRSDWDTLSKQQRQTYTDQLIIKLKKKRQ